MISRANRISLIALLSFWILLFAATHIPNPELPRVNVSDKLIHAGAFFVLGLLFYAVLWIRGGALSGIWWKVLLILVLYGAFDEWSQQFVNRFTDVDDWLADTIGAAIAVTLMALVHLVKLRLE